MCKCFNWAVASHKSGGPEGPILEAHAYQREVCHDDRVLVTLYVYIYIHLYVS